MNIRRTIFLSVFGLYQVCIFIFTIYMESKKDDLNFLLQMFKEIALFKWGALIGVIFIAAEIVWTRMDSRKIANP
ncbi:hypothetical protein WSM22_08610 [Cytophagales bacterium WSM2-2]|nr:hypothetical protein WSM22_08610 [Cytophagales bacterium WSM2-2]